MNIFRFQSQTTTTNKTLGEITNDAQKGLLISWCFFLRIFSIAGNSLVLVAFIKYHALKLAKISVILIENISLADLCYAALEILVVGPSSRTNG